jgi:hypothetical protein
MDSVAPESASDAASNRSSEGSRGAKGCGVFTVTAHICYPCGVFHLLAERKGGVSMLDYWDRWSFGSFAIPGVPYARPWAVSPPS